LLQRFFLEDQINQIEIVMSKRWLLLIEYILQ
jgi:hypothetical protein